MLRALPATMPLSPAFGPLQVMAPLAVKSFLETWTASFLLDRQPGFLSAPRLPASNNRAVSSLRITVIRPNRPPSDQTSVVTHPSLHFVNLTGGVWSKTQRLPKSRRQQLRRKSSTMNRFESPAYTISRIDEVISASRYGPRQLLTIPDDSLDRVRATVLPSNVKIPSADDLRLSQSHSKASCRDLVYVHLCMTLNGYKGTWRSAETSLHRFPSLCERRVARRTS